MIAVGHTGTKLSGSDSTATRTGRDWPSIVVSDRVNASIPNAPLQPVKKGKRGRYWERPRFGLRNKNQRRIT